MRIYYRRGGKGAAPEGFDRVYTEVDRSGSILRELLAYVRAGDSVTVEMGGELGGTAGAFVEMALALYQRQATLLCKSPKIDTAAGHWQAVLSDLALLTRPGHRRCGAAVSVYGGAAPVLRPCGETTDDRSGGLPENEHWEDNLLPLLA